MIEKKYRADIDGLRAVAIIPVVLFHVGSDFFSGGYVGVDIFFVISGYLITSIIYHEVAQNAFSIAAFYERRIRRILPALIVVLSACLVSSWFLFLPFEFGNFGRSLIAAIFFVANIQFWQEAGYFDVDAETKPLLHTWSLSVEEQFYILFPPALILLHRFWRTALIPLVALTTTGSFVFAVWSVQNYPNAAFYLLPSRIWELGLGSLLALGAFPTPKKRPAANMLGVTGLALILYSVCVYSDSTPFPGLAALPPCLGAALLICSGGRMETWTGHLLSYRPLVFIGLISYSLYLWHWPLVVYLRHLLPASPSFSHQIGIVISSLLLAIASWHYVEKPFRSRSGLFTQQKIFALSFALIIALSVAAFIVVQQKGFYFRVPKEVLDIANVIYDRPKLDKCYGLSGLEVSQGKLCIIGETDKKPEFVVWGDSHAYALMPLLDELSREYHVAGLYAPHGACAPLIGAKRADKSGSTRCLGFNAAVARVIASTPSIQSTLLIGRWAENYETERYVENAAPVLLDDVQAVKEEKNQIVFARTMERTLKFLHQQSISITVVAQIPDVDFNPPRYLATQAMLGRRFSRSFRLTLYEQRQKGVMNLFNRLKRKYQFDLIYPHRWLCDDFRCSLFNGENLIYRDNTHLTVTGSEKIRAAFVPYFQQLILRSKQSEQ